MHPWDLSVDEARMLQETLASDCQLGGDPDIETVAGVDIAMYRDSKIAVASAVLYSIPNQKVLEERVYLDDLTFPYVPGLLAFREAPIMLEAIMKLDGEPDCLLVDGHGYAHPRRFGLASHLGLLLDIPSIGCTKSLLVGEFDSPESKTGSFSDIWDGEPVGYAIRTKSDANPIFLSPGHKISRENILSPIKSMNQGSGKLPLPVQKADNHAGSQLRILSSLAKPFVDRDIGAFLVGGALRDLLLGVIPKDYDLLVTKFPDQCREELENYLESHFFDLDDERQFYRCSGKEIQVDVTVVGQNEVVDDLKRRDFSVNSIALELNRESWIDPLSGRDDVQNNILKSSGSDSIVSDPIRILRAYRLAQEYGFKFSSELKQNIVQNNDKLHEVSKERVINELLKIINGRYAVKYLKKMEEHGFFQEITFLRKQGIDNLEMIESWNQVLQGHKLLSGDYHGNFTLLAGFRVGRLFDPDELKNWPLHKAIKSVTYSSYKAFPKEPTYEILEESHRSLLGRMLGQGLNSGWSAQKIGSILSGVQRYISQKKSIEKEIVENIDADADEIGKLKDKKLETKLPELWNESMSNIEVELDKN